MKTFLTVSMLLILVICNISFSQEFKIIRFDTCYKCPLDSPMDHRVFFFYKIDSESDSHYIGKREPDPESSNWGINNIKTKICQPDYNQKFPKFDLKFIKEKLDKNAFNVPFYLMMYTIANGEGQYFNTINTYDNVNFTIGPFQFAAHSIDFVKYLKYVLLQPNNPFLELNISEKDNKIHRKSDDSLLENQGDKDNNNNGNLRLRHFLNPNFNDTLIENQELINIARFQYFIMNEIEQINLVGNFKEHLAWLLNDIHDGLIRNNFSKGLNNLSLRLCCVIVDIIHHGRGKLNNKGPYKNIADILNRHIGNIELAYEDLININMASKWEKRRKSLRNSIDELSKNIDYEFNRFYFIDRKFIKR